MTEFSNVAKLIYDKKPTEFYNLAAQSFVKTSFSQPIYSTHVNSLGVIHCLEAIRIFLLKLSFIRLQHQKCLVTLLIKELTKTKFAPVSPYAVTKLYSYHMTKLYRDAYNLFV